MKLLCALLLLICACTRAADDTITHGRFESVRVEVPQQDPGQLVLLLSDDVAKDSRIARVLAANGALVATIDTRALLADLERDGDECVSPDGDLENLAHYIQAIERLDTYHAPILVGDGVGAAFVYAMLAQAPADTFAGGISIRFCPELALHKRLCETNRLKYARTSARTTLEPARLERPWTVLDPSDGRCAADAQAFAATAHARIEAADAESMELRLARAYKRLADAPRQRVAQPRPLADLPLIEVAPATPGPTFAVMLSGDGGWAGLDKETARRIAQAGIPVVGFDSLRYFWTPRDPERLARDLDRIVATYAQRWQRKRVVLIGYSVGADVLPFAINRLDATSRSMVSVAVLIGLSETAQFEFHLGNWIGMHNPTARPTSPEMQRIRLPQVACIYGADDGESACPKYQDTAIQTIELPGGHHFNGDYAALARVILRELASHDGSSPRARKDARSDAPAANDRAGYSR